MFRRLLNYVSATIGVTVLTAVLVSSAFALPLTGNLVVSPVPNGPIYAGSSFFDVFVEVDIPSLDPLSGFGFNVSAPGLGTPAVTSSFFDITPNLPNVLGTLDPFNPNHSTPVSGNNTKIAVLTFYPSTQGNFNITITADPNNINEGLLGDNTQTYYSLNLTTSVNVLPHPVPEPATLILIGIGLITCSGITISRRRSINKHI